MIRAEQSRYPVTAQTHAGMTGKNNEDRFGVSAYRLHKRSQVPALLAVLCDGIGGHRAGEVAAEMAVNIISQTVAESDARSPVDTLESGIHRASNAIHQEAKKDKSKHGMGATTACVFLLGNRLYTATVGDSRIYLIRGERIRQLSTDHTWVQDALDHNLITQDEAANHPNRHVIRRYLGSPQPPDVDFRLKLNSGEASERAAENQGTRLQPGDRLVLCSDGLTDLVSDAEIQSAFDRKDDQTAVQDLIDLANQRGGHDNITIVTILVPQEVASFVPKKRSLVPVSCAATAVLIGLVVALVLGYFLWQGFPWEADRGTATPPIRTIDALITSQPQSTATGQVILQTPTATVQPVLPTETALPETTIEGYPSPPEATDGSASAGYP